MWLRQIKYKLASQTLVIAYTGLLMSCANCEEAISYNILPREGSVLIDTIYSKWGDHASTAANRAGQRLLFNELEFEIPPQVGDSLVKRKGEAEYTLFTKDSVYVQRFDCATAEGIVISSTKRN